MSITDPRTRSDFPTDYDEFAPTYAWSRWPLPWVVAPLESALRTLPADVAVLEIGCGTGNYIRTLAEARSDIRCFGIDLSLPMLREARRFGSGVRFARGDAGRAFPFVDSTFHVAFAVDVIHHIASLDQFFAEAYRVLAPGGELIVITDSEDTLKRRSLTRFFPGTLEIEIARYPRVAHLDQEATRAGFTPRRKEEIEGEIPLDDRFVAALEARCSSSVRLLPRGEHAEGMRRIAEARSRGETWTSVYVVLHYLKKAGG